ncbi:MAG TPA: hypothetical protein VH107_00430 [Lacipirellulaceae bacterium]|jgi:uncharacterized protein (DUF983 family)|nr:hypothetical protein [Lacipirellulaceae bacterium]
MVTNLNQNENWGTCPRCGEPVLIDPVTHKAEPCATCASRKSPGVAMGTLGVIAGIIAIAALAYLCIRILLK